MNHYCGPNKFLDVMSYYINGVFVRQKKKKLTDIFISPTTFSDNATDFFKDRTIIFFSIFFSDNASKCPGPKIAGIVTKSAKVGPKKLSLPP